MRKSATSRQAKRTGRQMGVLRIWLLCQSGQYVDLVSAMACASWRYTRSHPLARFILAPSMACAGLPPLTVGWWLPLRAPAAQLGLAALICLLVRPGCASWARLRGGTDWVPAQSTDQDRARAQFEVMCTSISALPHLKPIQ